MNYILGMIGACLVVGFVTLAVVKNYYTYKLFYANTTRINDIQKHHRQLERLQDLYTDAKVKAESFKKTIDIYRELLSLDKHKDTKYIIKDGKCYMIVNAIIEEGVREIPNLTVIAEICKDVSYYDYGKGDEEV